MLFFHFAPVERLPDILEILGTSFFTIEIISFNNFLTTEFPIRDLSNLFHRCRHGAMGDTETNKKKEVLPALHGYKDGVHWFSWYGQGENQLHFTGEKTWCMLMSEYQ